MNALLMNYEDLVCDANSIYEGYLSSIKGSAWKESTQKYMLNYLHNIFKIQHQLQTRTLQNGKAGAFILSERGKTRFITSIPIQDRIVRHVLCDKVLLPEIKKRIIYDNGASVKGRGLSFSRGRFETHLRKYYMKYGNAGYILFGDFSKFYDNIIHKTAINQLLHLVDNDPFVEWLLSVIFKAFETDVSYLSDDEYSHCYSSIFNRLQYETTANQSTLTGSKIMKKSVSIGDQLSQVIGTYYPHDIDNYVKYVRQQKYYGRYQDDWYIMNPDKQELDSLRTEVTGIASRLGIHINEKKTRIVSIKGPYKYLQIKYCLGKTGKINKSIDPKKLSGMKRKLRKLKNKSMEGDVSYQDIETMFKSWIGNCYKLLSKQQRMAMLKFYEDLFDRKISIDHGKIIMKES